MKKKLSVILFIFLTSVMFAQNLAVDITYHDKKVYYTDATSDIFVRVSLTNRGAETLYFKLADNHEFSLDFTAIDTKNKKCSSH